ncbi:GOLPH3/VPS74 family protein [Jiangella alkaliphila]|uniref:Golgi phosphoprotein 3 (GPP34) n=1 Tax=Jiangella alkaliphila TaxID=419479 RepID=A0A1H2L2D8_9ACTN|nr:GPP34 family phosphoprotein [Jiangella alkaliphila]SDU75173.1 Golgi phosphoprotein 3 (GPP34) [Jiangella alkaliphila]
MDLLIVEDFMLLLLDDDSGSPAGAGTLHYSLGGALLVDLALQGRIEIESKGVTVLPGPPPDDPLLADALEKIGEKRRSTHSLLFVLGQGLSDKVTERLLERGLIRREQRKFLGLFRTTTWPADDARHEAELRAGLERVLVHGDDPDARTAAIIALLNSINVLYIVVSGPDFPWRVVAKRAYEIQQGDWAGDPATQAVMTTNAGIVAATASAVAVAAATGVANS